MNRKNTDIALNTYLPSLLNGLKSDGVNINKYLNTSLLKNFNLFDCNGYIPTVLHNNLMASISNDLGVESFAVEFSNIFRATEMGRVSNYIFQSPNFQSFLENVIRFQKIIRSNYCVNLNINGPISKFSVKINEAKSRAKLILEEIDIIRILDAFTLVGGEGFIPIELGVTSKSLHKLELLLPKGDYKVHLNQDESWILFETAMLSKEIPNLIGENDTAESISETHIMTFKIERLLESFNPGSIPTLDELAFMFNTSRRTLERNLNKEGTSFLRIKQNYLQRKSYELLTNPKLSVKEISEQLDYLHPQNFIRCFKKWTGTSPLEYRARL